MANWCRSPLTAITLAGFVWTAQFSGSAAVACSLPDPTKISIAYPQGAAAQIKLYETNKGGLIGSIEAAQISGKVELCSQTLGPVNEVRIPKNAAINFRDGKSGTPSGKYWVRRNQIEFEDLKNRASKTVFVCERNHVKTRFSGGAAGNEECEK